MSNLKNYIRQSRSTRQSWEYTDSHPLIIRKYAVGGALIPSLGIGKKALIAAGSLGAGIGAYFGGKELMGETVEDGDVRVRIDDDNSWGLGSGNPTLTIEIAKGVGTAGYGGGDLIDLGQSYSFELTSAQPAYMIKKALGLRQSTAADNVSYSVDPVQLAAVLESMGGGIFADSKDAMIVRMEVIPVLNQIAEVMAIEKDYSSGVYVVQRGDTLAIIADKVGMSIEDIIMLNPELQGPQVVIEPGMELIIGEGSESEMALTEDDVIPATGAGRAIEGIRDSYMGFNTSRLGRKAERNASKADELEARAKNTDNPRKRRRLSNRATRAEARSMKAKYKSENLR